MAPEAAVGGPIALVQENDEIILDIPNRELNIGIDAKEISERKNHHPEILIEWGKVSIQIASHDMGGVTTKCINLAMEIELSI